jgi:hypothetical protein
MKSLLYKLTDSNTLVGNIVLSALFFGALAALFL